MAFLRSFRSNNQEQSAQAESRLGSHQATIITALYALTTEMTTIRLELAALRLAFTKLDDFRRALEAKTWMAFQARHAGRVAGGVARAATARRDVRGRYVSQTNFSKSTR